MASKSDHSDNEQWWNAYKTVPVRIQTDDIMVYAHRTHRGARDMLDEIGKLGIVRVFSRLSTILCLPT